MSNNANVTVINRETGFLATIFTPPELVEERVYEILPPEAADWVREAYLATDRLMREAGLRG